MFIALALAGPTFNSKYRARLGLEKSWLNPATKFKWKCPTSISEKGSNFIINFEFITSKFDFKKFEKKIRNNLL